LRLPFFWKAGYKILYPTGVILVILVARPDESCSDGRRTLRRIIFFPHLSVFLAIVGVITNNDSSARLFVVGDNTNNGGDPFGVVHSKLLCLWCPYCLLLKGQ
jgi:hypothetical protein